jgi:hypothetical protein
VVWLETLLLIEAAVAFWLSALNLALLTRVVGATRQPARRTAAVVLAGVCAGQAVEALAFMWFGAATTASDGAAAAILVVRTALIASTGSISVLLLRASSRGR